MALVYMAGPIDMNTEGHDRKDDIVNRLKASGHVCYCPWRAFDLELLSEDSNAAGIKHANLALIEQCDAMVAHINHIMSYGTVVDMEYARECGIPIFVWLDIPGSQERPAYLWDFELHRNPQDLCMAVEIALTDTSPRPSGVPTWMRSCTCEPSVPATLEVREKTTESLVLPVQATKLGAELHQTYPGDAGFDLPVSERTVVQAKQWKDVPTGVKISVPIGYWGLVLGRSSTFYKRSLHVHPAVIDAGYTGDLKVAVMNSNSERIAIEEGERIAQLIIVPKPFVIPVEMVELPEGERGDRGFGSSGK